MSSPSLALSICTRHACTGMLSNLFRTAKVHNVAGRSDQDSNIKHMLDDALEASVGINTIRLMIQQVRLY